MKIGIILTTFLRDELLYKSVQSIKENWQDNFELIIVDQGEMNTDKHKWLLDENLSSCYYSVSFDCGLSYARNYGVQKAKELCCDYCVISADSIIFDNTIKKVNKLLYLFKGSYKLGKIGFKLNNRIGWEGWLSIIPNESFKLKFINKNIFILDKKIHAKLIPCNICKNFYIALTESLLKIPYDNTLKLLEHEDHSIQYAKYYNTLWTDLITGTYKDYKPEQYKKYRRRMYREFMQILLKKYNLKKWIVYENLQYSKT